MGFDLHALMCLRWDSVVLFDQIVAGAGRTAVRLPQHPHALPVSWAVPNPFLTLWDDVPEWVDDLEMRMGEAGWLERLGADDPMASGGFSQGELVFAALLSLAGPVVLVDDETHGGVISHEAAAGFDGGRIIRSAREDHLRGGRWVWMAAGGALAAMPRGNTPVSWCAAAFDRRFDGAFLWNGYFPRTVEGPPADAALGQRLDVVRWPEGWPAWLMQLVR